MTCRPVDPCYRWAGKISQMSDEMANEIVQAREDSSTLSPQQLRTRSWIEQNVPRAPPGSGLIGTGYNILRTTAIVMTTIESSGYFERTPEVQRYEESVLGSWSPGGMIL
jgi:hypothetical protein